MAGTDSNRSRAWVWALVTVVLLVVIYFWVHSSHSETTVRTAVVERHDLISSISTNGKVEPTQDYQAHAPMPSVISKLFVHLGEHVKKGQELLRLDASDEASKVASAQAALTASRAALQNMRQGGTQAELLNQRADLTAAQQQEQSAQAQLTTLQRLRAKGAASASEVSQAQQRLTEAQAKVAQVQTLQTSRYSKQDLAAQRAQVTESQAALSAAESGYAGVDFHAPFSGTVYSLPVAQYNFVGAGEALVSVADLTKLQVRAYFDEPEIGKLAAGEPVKIVWDAKPDRVWHGHIVQAPTTVINYGTRNVGEAIIGVDDASGDLLPNTNVTVTVTTSQRTNVLSLPREALRTEGMTNYVYRIVNGSLVRTPVQVGVVNLTRVEITGGLQQGDVVALGATTETDLTNGMRVKPE